jgi:adenosylhomocysteine nucleosidase
MRERHPEKALGLAASARRAQNERMPEANRERLPFAVLCALSAELGSLGERVVARRQSLGLEVLELAVGPTPVLAAVCGVGKVQAARAATVLFAEGARRGLFVVGTCGGLKQSLVPGTLVHCTRAAQTDFVRLEGRESAPDDALLSAWQAVAPGASGWFLTADRPVLSLWRRLRLARAFAGPCVADMETAAAAAAATLAGVPWAALRTVTDRATEGGHLSFRTNFASQAGRAADTLPALLERLSGSDSAGLPRSAGPR